MATSSGPGNGAAGNQNRPASGRGDRQARQLRLRQFPQRRRSGSSPRPQSETGAARRPRLRQWPCGLRFPACARVTETSMIFMIPIPPTSSDTPAIEASKPVMTLLASEARSAMSARLRTVKSSGLFRANAMAVTQQSHNLLLRGIAAGAGLGGNHYKAQPRLSGDLLSARWSAGRMIVSSWSSLIAGDCPLATSTPTTTKGRLPMRMVLPTGLGGGKKIFSHRLANHGHVGCGGHVIFSEAGAALESPGANVKVFRCSAGDARAPIVVFKDHLGGSLCAGRGGGHRGTFFHAWRQRLRAPASWSRPNQGSGRHGSWSLS